VSSCRPCLELAQQVRILDGDDRLVGEGLEQNDLVGGESPGLTARYGDRAERFLVPQQRDGHETPEAACPRRAAHGFKISRILLGVRDIEWSAAENRLGVRAARVLGVERLRVHRPLSRVAGGISARDGHEYDLIADNPGQPARVPAQQAKSAAQDRFEHRLHIRLRAADDAQDVAGGGLRVQRRGQLASGWFSDVTAAVNQRPH
jgi:hypothetical protein